MSSRLGGSSKALRGTGGLADKRHVVLGMSVLQWRACIQHTDCHDVIQLGYICLAKGTLTEGVDIELGSVDVEGEPALM